MGYFHVIFPMSEKYFHDTHSRIQSHREMTRAHVHCRDHPAMVKNLPVTLRLEEKREKNVHRAGRRKRERRKKGGRKKEE